MKKSHLFLPLWLTAATIVTAAPTQAPTRVNSLATVALPTYIDATGSKNYGYLAPSLTDAIDASMQQKFDYARADKMPIKATMFAIWPSR